MLPTPLGLRLDPSRSIREQVRDAARLGARGVVIDATGDLAPARLSDTGRRELRHLLRSVELSLVALNLPTRRSFDTPDQLDDRLTRAEMAFTLAYELGTTQVLARVGGIPTEADAPARETFLGAVRELGRRADHRGVRLAVETGPDAGEALRTFLDALASPGLAASLDPAALLQSGHDPVAVTRALGLWVAHAYATDPTSSSVVSVARRGGLPPGSLDWLEYLGGLEEINYRGYLTIWPDPTRETGPQFTALADRLKRL
ncbi:MAG: sugar phosphate isomerase/epimerase [Planctomycetia bacterium]|nr:sugar phosphate isomerase/epimerase [Planctomycetia bacterium]